MSTKKKETDEPKTRGVNTRKWTCVAVDVQDNEVLGDLCTEAGTKLGRRVTRAEVVGALLRKVPSDLASVIQSRE